MCKGFTPERKSTWNPPVPSYPEEWKVSRNYVFFNGKGLPEQSSKNIQVVSARIKQDIMYRAFGWENEVAYQLSSEKSQLPLPDISAYSNIYLAFKLAKVLTVQIGANVYYNTAYYAPYYEPATQQFQVQEEDKKVRSVIIR